MVALPNDFLFRSKNLQNYTFGVDFGRFMNGPKWRGSRVRKCVALQRWFAPKTGRSFSGRKIAYRSSATSGEVRRQGFALSLRVLKRTSLILSEPTARTSSLAMQ